MKYLIVLIIVFAGTALSLEAQEIRFDYDDAGNRIKRYYVPNLTDDEPNGGYNRLQLAEEENSSEEAILKIEVYPNPVDNILTINLEGSDSETITPQLSIFSSNGQLILTQSIAPGLSEIPVDQLSAGNYQLVIKTDKNIKATSFIKL